MPAGWSFAPEFADSAAISQADFFRVLPARCFLINCGTMTEVANNQVLLHTEGLVKIYGGRRVVDGVDINVKRSEVVGLLGPNGAGKTTTFYMTVGLVKPDGGKVFFDGT